ncbi:hypothetical protein MPL1_02148 [Methylophaga lonarensis MPL]|uniref:ATP-grasp domain-containing protein n=1 Tax=Methylophaga lonarensis MPL TaxID=1286106 RepID=M7NYL2_9GAMM|nr:ATP-grasp domain-containing protein [Methylophaga lonarensis]EMR13928.1 hypothetical protein MPL1_02148 [Methylophaga lonarensis MPL]
MKLFIYEHITSGALIDEPLPQSLAHEGDVMLQSIVQDLLATGHTSLTTLRDHRLPTLNLAGLDCLAVKSDQDFSRQWQRALNDFELFLLIAPETDGQLLTLHQQVRDAGKIALGSSLAAIEICSDKMKTALTLRAANISTPETWLASDWLKQAEISNRWVVKPFDGAGCLDTMQFETSAQTRDYLGQLPLQQHQKTIVQPFIEGDAISISLYVNDLDSFELLSINHQHMIIENQQLTLSGVAVNSVPETQLPIKQAMALSRDLIQAIPGLQGFVGVDVILQPQQPVVIEINPRLTTAYAGLSAAKGSNMADYLVSTVSQLSGKTS